MNGKDLGQKTTMRTAIFGGSFNPVHLGHLKIIQELCQLPRLSRLILSPAGQNPLKQQEKILPISLRAAMLAASLNDLKQQPASPSSFFDQPKLVVDWFEAYGSGKSYSLSLVERLQHAYPTAKFAWVLGEDALAKIELWFEKEKFLKLVDLWVMKRGGFELGANAFLSQLCPEGAADRFQKGSNSFYNNKPAAGKPKDSFPPAEDSQGIAQCDEQAFYPTIYGKKLCYLPFQIPPIESSSLYPHFLTAPTAEVLQQLAAYMPEAALEAWQVWSAEHQNTEAKP